MMSSTTTSAYGEEEAFYHAAHDLRAPLNSVKGLLHLIRQDDSKENQSKYFSMIEQSVNRMDQSINEIIGYFRGDISPVMVESVDLEKIGREAMQILRYMAGEDSVKIELDVEQDGPFFCDPKILFSIFNNLLSNAIRYRDTEKESFIKMTISSNENWVNARFQDNGIGIPLESQKKIFDHCYMVDPTRGGSGMGLYMVKKAIEKLGGTIEVNSQVGEGTLFIVQLPSLLRYADHK